MPFRYSDSFSFISDIVDMCVAARHLRPLVAQVALDDVVRNSEIDHARSNRVAELMRLEAEQLAVGVPDVVIVGKAIDPMSEAGLLDDASSFSLGKASPKVYPSGAHCGLLFLHRCSRSPVDTGIAFSRRTFPCMYRR